MINLPLFVAVVPHTFASTLEIVPVAKPIVVTSVAWASGSMHDICGDPISTSREGASVTSTTFERCDYVADSEHGVFDFAVVGLTPEWAHVGVSSDELLARRDDDIAFLVAMGFDPLEFGTVRTVQFAARDRDEVSGEVSTARVLGTKTFIDRSIAEFSILANRIVVTRDVRGRITAITGAWPVLAAELELEVSDTLDIPDAEETVGAEVLSTEPVLVLAPAVEGVVTAGSVYTEVILTLRAPDGGVKPSALYIMDGRVTDPRSRWGGW